LRRVAENIHNLILLFDIDGMLHLIKLVISEENISLA